MRCYLSMLLAVVPRPNCVMDASIVNVWRRSLASMPPSLHSSSNYHTYDDSTRCTHAQPTSHLERCIELHNVGVLDACMKCNLPEQMQPLQVTTASQLVHLKGNGVAGECTASLQYMRQTDRQSDRLMQPTNIAEFGMACVLMCDNIVWLLMTTPLPTTH